MDFVSKSFPNNRVHIALYQIQNSDEKLQVDQYEARKAALASIAKTY